MALWALTARPCIRKYPLSLPSGCPYSRSISGKNIFPFLKRDITIGELFLSSSGFGFASNTTGFFLLLSNSKTILLSFSACSLNILFALLLNTKPRMFPESMTKAYKAEKLKSSTKGNEETGSPF